ncbi:hypothetical protein [Sphingobacterium bovistauri]|uniref:Uncharacterized protein n=1 Tax=Sphingobacterium bovistauri TaxID=2781959 RepID=A0ABS7Z4U8_9SPHI|nr:hypothetical protein [Sphingobacterium bovistauri]MCA5005228.1 hypothetical protein [Sphingobacterium bovistauri]
MKLIFHKYIVPFFVAFIVFVVTMMKGEAMVQEHVEWSPKLYGHFFPVLQDGANSLSVQMDLGKFLLELFIFYILFLLICRGFNIKFNRVSTIVTSVIFAFTTIYFVLMISIEFSFTKINTQFNYNTLQSMWFNN